MIAVMLPTFLKHNCQLQDPLVPTTVGGDGGTVAGLNSLCL